MQTKTIKVSSELSPQEVFANLHNFEGAFFLDTADATPEFAEWSFLGHSPIEVIESAPNDKLPITAIEKALVRHAPAKTTADITLPPFSAGLVGYLSYDLKNSIEQLPKTASDDQNFSELRFGVYDSSLAYNHTTKKWYVSFAHPTQKDELISLLSQSPKDNDEFKPANGEGENIKLRRNMQKHEYLKSVSRIREYIARGDIYQANFAQRFEFDTVQSAHTLYLALRNANPAPFAAFLSLDNAKAVLSSSPERLLSLNGSTLETRPIKGTIKRGDNPHSDKLNASELLKSTKDAAELAMIVDLARNDLGRVSEFGTVRVSESSRLESYKAVHHLVAVIKSKIREGVKFGEIVSAVFPGGSITGAPKIRAMQIIDELESTARSVYTGSIGYIDFSGRMDFNIAIRTALYDAGRVTMQFGGGIVADSVPEYEYEECKTKARAMFEAFGIDLDLFDQKEDC